MNNNLSFAAALGTMNAIAEYTSADFDALGIQAPDFALTYEAVTWSRDNRRRVMATLDALLFGTLDVLGLARIQVPAEFAAAVIATFVAPQNRLIACKWMEEHGNIGASAHAAAGASVDTSTAKELFDLVICLSETDDSSRVRQQYRARMNQRYSALMTREAA